MNESVSQKKQIDKRNQCISNSKQRMYRQGLYIGGKVPFGFKMEDGKLVEEPYRKKALYLIHEATKNPDFSMGCRTFAAELQNYLNIDISHMTVSRLMRKFRTGQIDESSYE